MSSSNLKNFMVYFFTLQARNSSADKAISTFDFFKVEFIDKDIVLSKSIDLGENKFQLRNIGFLPGSTTEIGGTLTRLRGDIPPIGAADKCEERDIELKDNEGLLEKSHFVISKERNGFELISFQYAIEAGTVNTLGKLLQTLITHADEVNILAIIRQDAMKRMMNGVIKYVEYAVAKPKVEDYVAEDDFTKTALELMNETNATRFQGKISIGSRTKGLTNTAKRWISELIEQPETTKKLKVKLHEVDIPIDILGDQLKERISVPIFKANRPDTKDMLDAILTCKNKMYDHIKDAIDISQ